LIIRGPGLSEQYVANYLRKVREGLFYLSDHFGIFSKFLSLMSLGIVLVILFSSLAIWILNYRRKEGAVIN